MFRTLHGVMMSAVLLLSACLSEDPTLACARLAAHPDENAGSNSERFAVVFDKLDATKAQPACEKAYASDPSPQNAFRLGRALIAQKTNPEQHLTRATQLYSEASRAGYAFGDLGLGYLNYTYAKNGTNAHKFYRKAAEAGIPSADGGAAYALVFSPDTKARRGEGIRLMVQLAQNDPNYYITIATYFRTENPTKARLQEAVKAYEEAAKRKVPGAEMEIAYLYEDAKGPLFNLSRARSWGQKALTAKDIRGHDVIARSYYFAKTSNDSMRQKNLRQAYAEAQRGAAAGAAYSSYLAGYMLAKGQGVKRDTLAAEPLLNKASAQGIKAASDLLRTSVTRRAKQLRNLPRHSAQSCVKSRVSSYDRNNIDYRNSCDHSINVVVCERHVATEVFSLFDGKNREYCKTHAVGAGKYITNFYGSDENSAFLRKAISNTNVKVGACHPPLRPALSKNKVYCNE